ILIYKLVGLLEIFSTMLKREIVWAAIPSWSILGPNQSLNRSYVVQTTWLLILNMHCRLSIRSNLMPRSLCMIVELVRRFRGLRVLVIGDAMLDTYLEGTASRLCREGPVPVVRKTGEYCVPGGPANTAANLRALEAEVYFLTIVGRDPAGARLRAALLEQGVDDRWMVDAKNLYRFRNAGATVVTPNYLEARSLIEHGQISEPPVSKVGIDLSEVEHVGRHLLAMIDAEHAAITLAGDGVFLMNRRGITQ